MTPRRIMVIAGEASGDLLAAELVTELRAILQQRPTYTSDLQPLEADLAPQFFGAGGPKMATAGVKLAFDMTQHAVVGLVEVIRKYGDFRLRFDELLRLALEREPHVIICVDFSGFNRRFGHAVKQQVRTRHGTFNDWNPKIIQYVSPQVWASREGRARKMAADFDLLLSIFPFEKSWYAERLPQFPVEFVGHPMLDRHRNVELPPITRDVATGGPSVVLLPGSRKGELRRHVPVMVAAWNLIREQMPSATATMVLPSEPMLEMAQSLITSHNPAGLRLQLGDLSDVLRTATVALACTGTVTMECAYFGVPTVALYRTSWSTYEIGRRIIRVKYLAMPNLLADEAIFPEFIQHDATPAKLAGAALALLRDDERRRQVKMKLAGVIAALGGPGATRRAAEAIARLIP